MQFLLDGNGLPSGSDARQWSRGGFFFFLNGVVESFSLIITSTAHLIAIDKMGSNLNGTVLFDPFLVYNNNQVLLVGGAIGTH